MNSHEHPLISELVDLLKYSRSPGRKLGWQQSGAITVGSGATQAVTMQATFDEPDAYTVSFLQPFSFGNDPTVRCEALVMWNVEGTFKPVRVSVVGGMSITAAAHGVKVIMIDATPLTTGYSPKGSSYQVSCQAARGTRGFAAVAPYYIPQALANPLSIGPSSNQIVAVPFDAGVQSFFVTAVNHTKTNAAPKAGDLTILQLASSPNNVGPAVSVGGFDAVNTTGWVPTQPGCNQIQIFNNNASQTFDVSVVFGVDG